MKNVLEEIMKLRDGKNMVIDYNNKNRYRIVVQEDNGSKTAYYFSVPIYNQKSRKLVDVKFRKNKDIIYSVGSNAKVVVSNNISLENDEVLCRIEPLQNTNYILEKDLRHGDSIVFPTTNGIAVKSGIDDRKKMSFIVEVSDPFLNIRANDKYFALMKEQFRPVVAFSCIGAIDKNGNVIAPAKIEYQKLTDKIYCLTIEAQSSLAEYVLFEGNLYENKLFQDTTVESMNPTINNAFGSIAFIGNTPVYGEQWLYSRIDYSRISEIMDKRIHKMVMHLPKLNKSNLEMSAYKVEARFCSFGSTWNNKIPGKIPVSDSCVSSEYQSIDITSLLVDARTKTIIHSEGLILKPKIKGKGFSVVSTGDSYYAPQILEVVYRQ